jgi:hypothetical protein
MKKATGCGANRLRVKPLKQGALTSKVGLLKYLHRL